MRCFNIFFAILFVAIQADAKAQNWEPKAAYHSYPGLKIVESKSMVTACGALAAQNALKSNATKAIAVHCHQTTGGQCIDVGLFKINFTPDL